MPTHVQCKLEIERSPTRYLPNSDCEFGTQESWNSQPTQRRLYLASLTSNRFHPFKMKSFLALLLCLAAVTVSFAATPTEEIEGLLASVKSLDQAAFIRNGTEYTPAQAESHLRMKWKNGGSHIKTAEDFIALCASKSSLSGKPYLIRFADGHTAEAGTVFKDQLAVLRSKAVPPEGAK